TGGDRSRDRGLGQHRRLRAALASAGDRRGRVAGPPHPCGPRASARLAHGARARRRVPGLRRDRLRSHAPGESGARGGCPGGESGCRGPFPLRPRAERGGSHAVDGRGRGFRAPVWSRVPRHGCSMLSPPLATDGMVTRDPFSPWGRPMDETILGSLFSFTTFALLALLLVALLLARFITPVERLLITGAALVLAGAFFLFKPTQEPAFTLVAMVTVAAGLWLGSRAVRGWSRRSFSIAGPFALVFLLPPAFLGAVLMIGLAAVVVDSPVRLVMRVVVG